MTVGSGSLSFAAERRSEREHTPGHVTGRALAGAIGRIFAWFAARRDDEGGPNRQSPRVDR